MKRQGFTLVELMVAITILVIIGGAAYTSYNAALRVYRKHQKRMETVQKCRAALQQIISDLRNLFFIQDDQELSIVSEDVQNEEGFEQDMISFVRWIDPRYEFYQFVRAESEPWSLTSSGEETGTPVETDLIRVGYMIAEDPSLAEKTAAETSPSGTIPTTTLYRITTHALNYEEGIYQVFNGEVSPADLEVTTSSAYETEGGAEEVVLKAEPIAENALMLDFKYFDGEEWLDTWDYPHQLPKAVMVMLSVADETGEVTITEATVAYLEISRGISGGEALAQTEGTSGGQPGGGTR